MTLNGYTLKAVKTMPTLDWDSYSGNIYFENKKIGMAHNDGNGGMTDVQLLPEYRDHYPILSEDFVERLFTLYEYEKIYKAETKKEQNKALAFVTYSDFFDLSYYTLGQNGNEEGLRAHIQKKNPERGEIESIEIFRSPDDFNVTQPTQQSLAKKPESIYKDLSDWCMAKDYNGAECFNDGSRPLIAETKFADIVICGIPDSNKVWIGVYLHNELCDYFYEGCAMTKESAKQIGKDLAEYIDSNNIVQFTNDSFKEFFTSQSITNTNITDFMDEIRRESSTNDLEADDDLNNGEEI